MRHIEQTEVLLALTITPFPLHVDRTDHADISFL